MTDGPFIETKEARAGYDAPTLYAVDAEAGEIRWQRALEQIAGPVRSLAITDGTVVFSGVDAKAASRGLEATAWTDDDLQEREAAGRLAVHAVSAGDGQVRWSYAADVPDGARPNAHAVIGASDGTAVVTATRSDDFPDVDPVIRGQVLALDVATGEQVWSADLSTSTWRTPAVQLHGDVVVAEDITDDDNVKVDLVGRAAATGEELWRLSDHEPLEPLDIAVAVDDSLFLGTSEGLEIVDLRTGEIGTALEGFEVRAVDAEGTTLGVQVALHRDLVALVLFDVG